METMLLMGLQSGDLLFYWKYSLVIISVKVKGFDLATLKPEGISGFLSGADYFENNQNLRASIPRMHVMYLLCAERLDPSLQVSKDSLFS